jgi:hypothetical protein
MNPPHTETGNRVYAAKAKQPMICIPCMDVHIAKSFIFHVFCKMQIGYIQSISEFSVKHKESYKRVVIKLKWNRSELSQYIQRQFEEGRNIKIVHSFPWYWIGVLCRENSIPYQPILLA